MKKLSYPKDQLKIVLFENIHQSAEDNFRASGFVVERVDGSLSDSELAERIKDAHIVGIRSKTQLDGSVIEQCRRLLAVGCFCIGTNQVEVNQARRQGVPVFNAPFSNTRSVAEMILAEIVMLSRKIGERNTLMHQGVWKKSAQSCYEVRGKTLGIVGYGKIGSQVSVLAESFGMKVIFYDIVNRMPLGNSVACSSLSELLESSDYVSLHVPATALTEQMISTAELKKMKKGSYLLNASRGNVVNLEALRQSVESGHIAGAAIDVFPEEPKKNEDRFAHPLQGGNNIILTPHIGGSTEEAQYSIGVEVSSSLMKFIDEGATTASVNFPEIEVPLREGVHRILNVHKNVPGVLADINSIISKSGTNIQQQSLATDSEIGYLVMDVDPTDSDLVKDQIQNLPSNIKTRILY